MQVPRHVRQLRAEDLLESRPRFPTRRQSPEEPIQNSLIGRPIELRQRLATDREQDETKEKPTAKTPSSPPERQEEEAEKTRPRHGAALLPEVPELLRKGPERRHSRDRRQAVQQDEHRQRRLFVAVLRKRLQHDKATAHRAVSLQIPLVLSRRMSTMYFRRVGDYL